MIVSAAVALAGVPAKATAAQTEKSREAPQAAEKSNKG